MKAAVALQIVDSDSAESDGWVAMMGSPRWRGGALRRSPFELFGAEVAQRGVTTFCVVPRLDELEHRHARFGVRLKRTPLDELAFEGAKKLSAMALSKQS